MTVKGHYAYVKEWRKRNKDKRAEEARRYRAKHPDKVAAIKAKYRAANLTEVRAANAEHQRKRRAADRDGEIARYRRWREKREAELTAIAGRARPTACELCQEEGKTVFDHCHARGHFRGWLCDRCNRTLGQVKDSPALLRKMADYLEASNGIANDEEAERAA